MVIIFLIILSVFAVIYVVFNLVKREHISDDYCVGYFGTMGSGKTFMSVKTIRSRIKRFCTYQKWLQRLMWIIPIAPLIPSFRSWWHKRFADAYQDIRIFSTIPMQFTIKVSLFRKRKFVAEPLTVAHLMCTEKLPLNALVYIGEFGKAIASQFDYDNAFVQVNLASFVSFCRHWFLGRFGVIVIDEQAPSSVVKEVRVRLGTSYVLKRCKVGKVLPFYRVTCSKLDFTSGDAVKSDDDRETVNDSESARKLDKGDRFFWGFHAWWRPREYDSRTYSEMYYKGFTLVPPERYDGLKTTYLPIMPNNEEANKSFKRDRTVTRQRFGETLTSKCHPSIKPPKGE